MEQVILKVKQGLFSVEEIRLESDPEIRYVLYVVLNANGEFEWSVGFASIEDEDRIYTSVIRDEIKHTVLAHAIPLLTNALEIKTIHADSTEELAAYQTALHAINTIKLESERNK